VPGDELGGRYRLIRRIGRGGSATVFEATDTSLDRQVAVKVLHSQLSTDPKFLERFRSEARSAAALSNPNVMAVHDWGEDERTEGVVPFLVMELFAGGSLRAMLDSDEVFSPSQAIQIGIDACRGLDYAHGQELVHRDITPANLLFGTDNRLRIADFGLAKALAESGWTEPGKELVGTARYASPEQAQGLRLTPASDVYSLGLVLVEALSGSVPFSADTLLGTLTARVESDVPIPDVPEKLADVLRSMTQRDPEQRPTSNQAGIALLQAAEGMPRPATLPLVGLPDTDTDTATVADQDDSMFAPAGDVSPDLDVTMQATPEETQVAGTPVVSMQDEPVRRWPWLLLTVIAIAAAGWWAYGQFAGAALSTQPVPDVVGQTREEALETLGDTWVVEEKFDRVAEVGVGEVIRTDPPADTLLEEGQPLSYWISLGLPLIRVPDDDLVGRSQAQAEITLTELGLTLGEVETVNSEDVGAGNVISVESAALELPLGDPVNLVVSLGPLSRVIPELSPLEDVDVYLQNLELAGLGVERTDEFDNEVPLGQFVSITPAPGTAVERGSTVTAIVSLGPVPVPVPVSSGRPLGDVLDDLESVGLLAGQLQGPNGTDGSELARCPVAGTDPVAGFELQPGNPVVIFLTDCGDG